MSDVKEPRWLRAIALFPALAIASFGAVGLLCADLSLFSPGAVLVVGTALFAGLCACARPIWRRDDEKASAASTRCGIAAVVLSVVYAIWNALHASQHVQINRDGGLYLNTGKWIATHGTLIVHPFVGAFASSHAVVQTSNGMTLAGRQLEFSLSHMLPALLAVSQVVGGDRLMFLTNPILSGVALLAFYVLAGRVTRNPSAALGATACLALVMPQVSFSRDTTSEIPTQVLVFTAVWLLCEPRTWQGRRTALCAGLLIGLVQPMHIDGLAYMLGLPLAFASVWIENRRGERRVTRDAILSMSGGVIAGVLLGVLDLALRDRGYLTSVRGQVEALAGAAALTAVVAAVVAVRSAHAGRERTIEPSRERLSVVVGGVVVAVGFGAWFLRPALQTVRGNGNGTVAFVQTLEHVQVDSTRRYAELSVQWISWYLGPLTLTLAIIAFGVVAALLVKGTARFATRISVFMLAPPALLYLWRPSITPDHIWATRRFLPAVFPGVILLAFCAISVIARGPRLRSARVRTSIAIVLGVCAILYPARATSGVANMTEQRGEYAAVAAACRTLGPKSAAVILQDSQSFLYLNDPQTLRSFCNIPVAVLSGTPNASALRDLAHEWNSDGRRLFVVSANADMIGRLFPGVPVRATRVATNHDLLNFTLLRRPSHYKSESLGFATALVPPA